VAENGFDGLVTGASGIEAKDSRVLFKEHIGHSLDVGAIGGSAHSVDQDDVASWRVDWKGRMLRKGSVLRMLRNGRV